MYVPNEFREDDVGALQALMQAYSFALLVTVDDAGPFATHLPFLLDADRGPYGTLVGHVARRNSQWRGFTAGHEALVVFQGPHAYVSPRWYTAARNVPTWNYAAVHAYGVPRPLEGEAATRAVVERLVAVHEAGAAAPWSVADAPAEYISRLLGAIVAFELPITRLEGKLKLSQNKTDADREGVVAALRASGDPMQAAVATLMIGADPGSAPPLGSPA